MNSRYSQGPAGESSARSCSDGARLDTSNGTHTAAESLMPESETGFSTTHLSSRVTLEHFLTRDTPQAIREWLTSSVRASLASPSAKPESEEGQTMTATNGPQPSSAFAQYDLDSHSWKTYLDSSVPDTLEPFSGTWPKAGTTVGGSSYRLPSLERPTKGSVSGLLPTPIAPSKGGGSSRSGDRSNETPSLHGMARKGNWPTPTTGDAIRGETEHDGKRGQTLIGAARGQKWATPKLSPSGPDYARKNRATSGGDDLVTQVGGQLNPTWVEWLMGWPLEWTDLKPLEMDRYREWRRSYGNS